MCKGSSRTIAIEWTYGPDSVPSVNNPMAVLQAWLRFVDKEPIPVEPLKKAWRSSYAEMQAKIISEPTKVWEGVTSAMTASILHLIQLHIKPIHPTAWLRHIDEPDAAPRPPIWI